MRLRIIGERSTNDHCIAADRVFLGIGRHNSDDAHVVSAVQRVGRSSDTIKYDNLLFYCLSISLTNFRCRRGFAVLVDGYIGCGRRR